MAKRVLDPMAEVNILDMHFMQFCSQESLVREPPQICASIKNSQDQKGL